MYCVNNVYSTTKGAGILTKISQSIQEMIQEIAMVVNTLLPVFPTIWGFVLGATLSSPCM